MGGSNNGFVDLEDNVDAFELCCQQSVGAPSLSAVAARRCPWRKLEARPGAFLTRRARTRRRLSRQVSTVIDSLTHLGGGPTS